jgi:hypothetical protein
MIRHAAALTALLLLTACSDSVTLINPDATTGFKAGSTNQTEVVAALGKPLHTVQEADGTRIDQYPSAAGATSGDSIIPDWLGGESTGGAYAMISFEYTPGGILKDIKTGK